MPFITATLAALGTGLTAAAGTAAATGTAIATGAQGIATAATLAGTGASLYGNIQAGQASRDAEKIRERSMFIQAQRERRQVVRSAMQTSAAARTAAMAQGASEGSGLAGGLAQQQSDVGQRFSDTNTQQTLGSEMFAANARLSQGRTINAIGSGMRDFSKDLFAAGPAMGRIGAQWFGPTPTPEDPYANPVRRTDSAYGAY